MVIFVPVDPSIRKAVVILSHPHNHPMHPFTKPSFDDQKRLLDAVKTFGTGTATAEKVLSGKVYCSIADKVI